MLRNVSVCGVAIFALSCSAMAAEKITVPTWSGYYVGVTASGTNLDVSSDAYGKIERYANVNIYGEGSERIQKSRRIAVFGGQAGYNTQVGNIVFGPFIDLQHVNFNLGGKTDIRSWCEAYPDKNCNDELQSSLGSTLTVSQQVDVGFRAGYLVAPTLLAYGFAGYAHAMMDSSTDVSVSNYHSSETNVISRKTWANGLLLGVGLEKLLSDSFSIKTEFRHTEFLPGKVRVITAQDPLFATNSQSTDLTENSVLVSVNYRFAEH